MIEVNRKFNVAHIGIHKKANLNSGDTLLFSVVKDIFNLFFDNQINWINIQVWEEFDYETIKEINKTCDFIVLGGGGLFLKDQDGSDVKNSGWQWNCSKENLKKITIPLIVFAVGYNRFRFQEDFGKVFSDSMDILTEKSKFLGLRNHGSIKKIRNYLNNKNKKNNGIELQYCPTTLISKFKNLSPSVIKQKESKKKILSLNAAFDRKEMRFHYADKKYKELGKVIKFAQNLNWEIVVCSHKDSDKEIEDFLQKEEVSFSSVDLTRSSPKEIINYYAGIDLSVGMRKHSQMIAFGLNKPIFSLISHDEVGFFLKDIGYEEYGVDMGKSNFTDAVKKFLLNFHKNEKKIKKNLSGAQKKIWSETSNNFNKIKDLIKI